MEQYNQLREEWLSKLLGMFSSNRLYTEWRVPQPDEALRKVSKWEEFIATIKEYNRPTENQTLKNFHFRALTQNQEGTFPAFFIKEAKHCNFKCANDNCTAEKIAIREQIIIGTSSNPTREEALKK